MFTMNPPQQQTKPPPPPPEIIAIRHGDRIDFQDPEWAVKALRPHDPSLSDKGVHEAAHAGAYLRDFLRRTRAKPVQSVALLVSPLIRCIESARLIANAFPPGTCTLYGEPNIMEGQYWMSKCFKKNAAATAEGILKDGVYLPLPADVKPSPFPDLPANTFQVRQEPNATTSTANPIEIRETLDPQTRANNLAKAMYDAYQLRFTTAFLGAMPDAVTVMSADVVILVGHGETTECILNALTKSTHFQEKSNRTTNFVHLHSRWSASSGHWKYIPSYKTFSTPHKSPVFLPHGSRLHLQVPGNNAQDVVVRAISSTTMTFAVKPGDVHLIDKRKEESKVGWSHTKDLSGIVPLAWLHTHRGPIVRRMYRDVNMELPAEFFTVTNHQVHVFPYGEDILEVSGTTLRDVEDAIVLLRTRGRNDRSANDYYLNVPIKVSYVGPDGTSFCAEQVSADALSLMNGCGAARYPLVTPFPNVVQCIPLDLLNGIPANVILSNCGITVRSEFILETDRNDVVVPYLRFVYRLHDSLPCPWQRKPLIPNPCPDEPLLDDEGANVTVFLILYDPSTKSVGVAKGARDGIWTVPYHNLHGCDTLEDSARKLMEVHCPNSATTPHVFHVMTRKLQIGVGFWIPVESTSDSCQMVGLLNILGRTPRPPTIPGGGRVSTIGMTLIKAFESMVQVW